jgi:hypothetical protein
MREGLDLAGGEFHWLRLFAGEALDDLLHPDVIAQGAKTGGAMPSLTRWQKWQFQHGEKWSRWVAFTPENILCVPQGPGAYALSMRGREIGRLLAIDRVGVLDVGESGGSRVRLQKLFDCANGLSVAGHMAGWRLGSLGLLKALGGTAANLRFTFIAQTTKVEAYRAEGALLKLYYELFGELPPLNYKHNWSAYEDSP